MLKVGILSVIIAGGATLLLINFHKIYPFFLKFFKTKSRNLLRLKLFGQKSALKSYGWRENLLPAYGQCLQQLGFVVDSNIQVTQLSQ